MIAAGQIAAVGALGVLSGLFGGLFGIGGGVLAIPLLGLLFGLHQQMAQGTVLIMVAPNVLFGFWNYRRRVGVEISIRFHPRGGRRAPSRGGVIAPGPPR